MMKMKFGLLGRITSVLAGIVIVVAGMAWIGNAQDHANDPQMLSVPVTDSDWYEGGKDAPVVLVEYSDFQCPACRAYAPLIRELHETYGDSLKIVYRNYPLVTIHPNAQLAAQAAEASGIQGKFFQMHDILFGNQETWSKETDPTSLFVEYATAIGLDVEKFKTDLTTSEVINAIKDDVNGGDESKVSSTPTFFLNGVQISKNPQGFEPFKALIDAALNPVPTSSETATQ